MSDTTDEKGKVEIPIDLIIVKVLEIIGSSNIPVSQFPDMMRMVESGMIQPEKNDNKNSRFRKSG
ncbi:hypothetical protein [Metabacillus bambusae]|uniref:Uncharacterized protein n=1 Tax=Metabacillus bambusae TaxID=2795218 RepID=A0ABS3MZM7_9BACI|nr:hypothetical protein [Metabacillus bambusae]MBO1511270.1 hypothetical protein [Metabacillus bambusae]